MAQQQTRESNKAQSEERQLQQDSFLHLLLIIQNIYHELDAAPSTDTVNLSEGITEEQIIRHPVFQSEHPEYISAHRVNTSGPVTPLVNAGVKSELLSNSTYSEATLRTTVSIGIERYAEDSVRRGVKYEFGAKADGGNTIDCSGFVRNAVSQIEALRSGASANMRNIFSTHSDGQVCRLAQATNFMLRGDQVNLANIKAGMIIGIDSGDRGWDSGRQLGINHIGIVYADSETGKLMFAESKGGSGVTTTELSSWLERAQSRGNSLFAADVVKLAEDNYRNPNQTAPLAPEVLTASANPVAGTVPAEAPSTKAAGIRLNLIQRSTFTFPPKKGSFGQAKA